MVFELGSVDDAAERSGQLPPDDDVGRRGVPASVFFPLYIAPAGPVRTGLPPFRLNSSHNAMPGPARIGVREVR